MSAISSVTGDNPLISFTPGALPSAPAAPQVQTGEANPLAELSSEEFLGIILEELSNQDPFEPNDTSATLEQLSSLRNIEADISLQDQLQALVLQNSIGQAGSLIGREVEGLSNSGFNVTGIVDSVRVVDGESQLQLENGSTILFDNVTSVASVATEPDLATAGATTAPAAPVPLATAAADAAANVVDDLLSALAAPVTPVSDDETSVAADDESSNDETVEQDTEATL